MQLRRLTIDAEALTTTWTDGSTSSFHPLWLRDNCPTAGDKRKAFRTFSIVDMDPDLQVASAGVEQSEEAMTIVVEFSDGHVSEFDAAWLFAHRPEARSARPRFVSHFDAESELRRFPIPASGSREHADLLNAVAEWGAAIVDHVPTDVDGTEALAALIGHVRETDFGRLFNIVMEPETWTLSQSGLALAPHTDDPYRYTPSGTSILHCVQVSTDGGDSILVDGFALAAQLQAQNPEAFALLTEVSVPFIRHRTESVDQGEDVHLLAHAPVISLDRDGEVCGIRFHERSMDTLDLPAAQTGPYYRALIAFAKLVNDPAMAVTFRLQPGEAIVYDNQRVLHGRTAFTGSGGRRHLRLCTIDRDQFHSRLRRLRADHHLAHVDERLPMGSM